MYTEYIKIISISTNICRYALSGKCNPEKCTLQKTLESLQDDIRVCVGVSLRTQRRNLRKRLPFLTKRSLRKGQNEQHSRDEEEPLFVGVCCYELIQA